MEASGRSPPREGHSLANGEGRDGIRNRNRSAIASDVVHSSSRGERNLLCVIEMAVTHF